jgi:hypothetical protein
MFRLGLHRPCSSFGSSLKENQVTMIKPSVQSPSQQSMTLLSRLLLVLEDCDNSRSSTMAELKLGVLSISREQFDDLLMVANSNHVIMRGLEVFLRIALEAKDHIRADWVRAALDDERARITNALRFLGEVCAAIETEHHDVTVIKSLDHWPDLGSDLDLYTNANSEDICKLMSRRFNAQIGPRSWGDRLAGKWNFYISGLPEPIEIHMGRLGQTGEQVTISSHLSERTRRVIIGRMTFYVPCASDRLLISTLQRMYRHFYFRLCDVVDTAVLSEMGGIDFEDLLTVATNAGIWEGVATYLLIVSDYVKKHRGVGLELPRFVFAAARFGGDEVFYSRQFLRVPILPQAAKLYGSQLAGLLQKGEFENSARLSLLPWLATAAVVGQRLTGSDKGIW